MGISLGVVEGKGALTCLCCLLTEVEFGGEVEGREVLLDSARRDIKRREIHGERIEGQVLFLVCILLFEGISLFRPPIFESVELRLHEPLLVEI